MFLEVIHDTDHATKEAPPVVYLKRVKVTLETFGTARCVKGRTLGSNETQKVEAFDPPAIIIGEYDGLGNSYPITERIDLRKMLILYLDPEFLTPGFSTFNIELRHALKVKVVVECARKTFKAEWDQRDLQIYPEIYHTPTISQGNLIQANMPPVQRQNYATQPPAGIVGPPQYEAVTTLDQPLPSYSNSCSRE